MKGIVLFSGGLDSTTCLALAAEKFGRENIIALSIYYGQRHKKEIECAKKIIDYYGVEWLQLDLTEIFRHSDCTLIGNNKEIPKQAYEIQLKETSGNPVSTYVPFRNGLFLSVAASLAIQNNCQVVVYGAHKDDAAGSAYPDCSIDFNEAINSAIREGSGGKVEIIAPFIDKNKADIVKEGLRLSVPFELTWSCYEGGEMPCGVCGTCRDRIAAFKANGVEDPLIYDTRLKNKEKVMSIVMKPTAHVKCRIGGDWYECRFLITFEPNKYYPDYTKVQEFIMQNIDGKELNIEEAAKILYDYLMKYEPKALSVTNRIEDCKTHFDIDVTI